MDHGMEEKVLILKRSMKAAIRELALNDPRLVGGTSSLLADYIRGNDGPQKHWTPRLWFVIEQSTLTAVDLRRRLLKKELTFLDIREDVSNLASLCFHMVQVERWAYIELRSRVRQLILRVAELANQLEDSSHVQRTNWRAVLESFDDSDFTSHGCLSGDNQWARQLLEKLEFQHLIGAGGFGSCSKVLFGGKFPMTVKIVCRNRVRHPQASSDKAFASVMNCRHLCRVFACIPVEGYHISIQEYIRGVDVQKLVKHRTSLPVTICRLVMAQLGLAVHYLQAKGFIHRDIKPSNIMIMPGCRIKLIDYDTVKMCSGKYERGQLRSFVRKTFGEFRDAESAGTLMYLAPEVIEHRSYGRACDWWSMGVTMHYLSTGQPPFRHSVNGRLRDLIRRRKIPSLKRLEDPDQHALSRGLMCRDVHRRITGARFHEFRGHPFFKIIDWTTIEIGKGPLEDFEPLMDKLQESSTGRWSPLREVLSIKAKRLKRVVDIDHARKRKLTSEPVYTFLSDVMRGMLEAESIDHSVSESDLSEPVDEFYDKVQELQWEMVAYRFEEFLEDGTRICHGTRSAPKT